MSARILPRAGSVAKPQGSVRFPFTWQAAHHRCFTNALVRKPSTYMSDAISSVGRSAATPNVRLTCSSPQSATTQLNLDTLVTQHEDYCDALTAAGMRLVWAQSIDEPDSVFVEDTAVASGKSLRWPRNISCDTSLRLRRNCSYLRCTANITALRGFVGGAGAAFLQPKGVHASVEGWRTNSTAYRRRAAIKYHTAAAG